MSAWSFSSIVKCPFLFNFDLNFGRGFSPILMCLPFGGLTSRPSIWLIPCCSDDMWWGQMWHKSFTSISTGKLWTNTKKISLTFSNIHKFMYQKNRIKISLLLKILDTTILLSIWIHFFGSDCQTKLIPNHEMRHYFFTIFCIKNIAVNLCYFHVFQQRKF